MSGDWVREIWVNSQRRYWHGLAPVVWYTRGPYPWEQPPCTALVKEGPKSLVKWFKKGIA